MASIIMIQSWFSHDRGTYIWYTCIRILLQTYCLNFKRIKNYTICSPVVIYTWTYASLPQYDGPVSLRKSSTFWKHAQHKLVVMCCIPPGLNLANWLYCNVVSRKFYLNLVWEMLYIHGHVHLYAMQVYAIGKWRQFTESVLFFVVCQPAKCFAKNSYATWVSGRTNFHWNISCPPGYPYQS